MASRYKLNKRLLAIYYSILSDGILMSYLNIMPSAIIRDKNIINKRTNKLRDRQLMKILQVITYR